MHHHYQDIRSRIDEEPLWFDEHAVPRYCAFEPGETASIYAERCCLVLIECQGCGAEFRVCFSQTKYDLHGDYPQLPLEELAKSRRLHYGDPPNTGCCAAGATMNSIPRRVLEFWAQERDDRGWPQWTRKAEYEIDGLEPDWARDDDRVDSLPT